jgi:hypothetical protein
MSDEPPKLYLIDPQDDDFDGERTSHRAQERMSRFALVPFNKLKPGTASNYLIKDLLPRVGLVTVWGPPKCGKSFWMFDAALHVAIGWQYRDRHTLHGPVVYCAFEGAAGFHARAAAFRIEHGIAPDEDVPFYLMPARLDLVRDHEALITSIKAEIPDQIPILVVLDTLNRSLNGSESKDQDMSAYINAADGIRERFNCLVAIVHHCGTEGTRPRGHTSLTGAIESQIAVRRDAASQIVTLVEHMKDGREGEEIVSTLAVVEVGTDEDGDAITSCVIRPGGAKSEPAQKKRLSPNTAIALDLLRRAIDDAGEQPPASNHIPTSVKLAVRMNLWRTYYLSGSGQMADKNATEESRERTFRRAVENLKGNNLIGIWDELVWI